MELRFAIWVAAIVGAVLIFLVNDRLRGRLKQVISGIISIATFCLCGIGAYLWGWAVGLAAVVCVWALVALFRKPSLLIARSLVDDPCSDAEQCMQAYNEKQRRQTERDVRSGKWLEHAEKRCHEENRHMEAVVGLSLKLRTVRDVLERHSGTPSDVEELYRVLARWGLPPELREAPLRNATMLDWFLTNSVLHQSEGRCYRALPLENATVLMDRVERNPEGEAPPPD